MRFRSWAIIFYITAIGFFVYYVIKDGISPTRIVYPLYSYFIGWLLIHYVATFLYILPDKDFYQLPIQFSLLWKQTKFDKYSRYKWDVRSFQAMFLLIGIIPPIMASVCFYKYGIWFSPSLADVSATDFQKLNLVTLSCIFSITLPTVSLFWSEILESFKVLK